MSQRVLLRAALAACAAACVLLPATPALAGNVNKGDVWVDNVGQPAGPGHEMDPHLACANINLWGAAMADPSGSYTIDGWPPSGKQELVYSSNWSYDQSTGGSQILDVIQVRTLIDNAIKAGDAPINRQGFHFKLQFVQDPQKHKTFWVNCATPAISTSASSGVMGQPIHDVATLSGSNAATGTITWNVYAASDATCSHPLNTSTLSAAVDGDGSYTSPDFSPPAPGTYQWVATYSGDSQNLGVAGKCGDTGEQSTVSRATPSIATTATSSMLGGSIHDVATLSGGDNPTGTITWNLYTAGAGCMTSLYSANVPANGDGVYDSPDFMPTATGSYEWVASYGGDANNNSTPNTSCTDPNEVSTVSATPAPAISLIKLERDGASGSYVHGPISGRPNDTIDYQMTVINTGNMALVITFTDPQCDAGTLSAPTRVDGSFDPTTNTLSAGGELRYTCSHLLAAGDAPQFTNTATVSGQPQPSGTPVTATDSVVAVVDEPGMTVLKLQRNGASGSFTTGTITVKPGDTIEYEIRVTNTGNTPLALSLTDALCDAGTIHGPIAISGGLSGNVLAPGGVAAYTCSHVFRVGDPTTFTNTATVAGQPPHDPGLTGTSSVTATEQATKSTHKTRKKHKKHKKHHHRRVVIVVHHRMPTFTG